MRSIEAIIEHIESSKAEDNYHHAETLAHEALLTYTDDYRLYEELADIYVFQGKLEKADEVLSVAKELHPESTTGMYLRGYLATAKGEFEEAIEILTVANTNLPNNAEILRNL
jgi:tetratricopeptide (TPR) repeat protein